MMSSIQSMLEHYQPKTAEAYRNALKEIVQEIALYGMSKRVLQQADGQNRHEGRTD